ncbi:MAG TPA: Xaa-Pro dipeptidyl-peptidase [Kutzneria sp.]
MKVTRLSTLLTVLVAGVALLVAPASAGAAPGDAGSQPTYNYANAIRETAWVDTGLKDPAGKAVRVAADIIRPSELTANVPVIMDASPYYACCGRGNESQLKTYDSAGKPVQFPLYYDNYFVPRGYAIVLVDLAGTNRSNGCVDIGGPSDIGSARAVIDWLNGRRTGYTSATGSTTVKAGWTSGNVGMIGKSWDGTIANGVAATGVAGLKTIVPISAISSWYDYYRANGADLTAGQPSGLSSLVETSAAQNGCGSVQSAIDAGSPTNGNYTSWWDQRNYYAQAANVHASVFVAHGVEDDNVKPINFGQWWDALAAHGVERKIWLSQTSHVDPFDYRRGAWVDTLHQWFDHYLMGIDNGIQNGPQLSVERTPDNWVDAASFPEVATATGLKLSATTTNGLGKLGSTAPKAGAVESFTDNPSLSETNWATSPDSANSARVVFSSGTLSSPVTVSGTSTITVTASSSASSGQVSAVLVDLGPETIRNWSAGGEGITTLTTRSCFGSGTTGDTGCFLDAKADTVSTNASVISRGWADLGHSASLTSKAPLTPGKAYTMTFKLAPTDHQVAAGHRLALIVGGTDNGWITAGAAKPKITLDLTRTTIQVPLLGSLP